MYSEEPLSWSKSSISLGIRIDHLRQHSNYLFILFNVRKLKCQGVSLIYRLIKFLLCFMAKIFLVMAYRIEGLRLWGKEATCLGALHILGEKSIVSFPFSPLTS